MKRSRAAVCHHQKQKQSRRKQFDVIAFRRYQSGLWYVCWAPAGLNGLTDGYSDETDFTFN